MTGPSKFISIFVLFGLISSCGNRPESLDEQGEYTGPNPFLEYQGEWAEDTGYLNLRGRELHVTLEGELEAPEWRIFDAPGELAQFTLIYLKKNHDFYLELLAEDATAPERVEWLVDGEWLTKEQAERVEPANLKHFRMLRINAVVLDSDYNDARVGQVYEAKVPRRPYSIMEEADDKCAGYNSHMNLSQGNYWYLWYPNKSSCPEELVQTMTVTIDELLPDNPESYPEYQLLWADDLLTVAAFFGKQDDGAVKDDSNWQNVNRFANWLVEADFTEVPQEDNEDGDGLPLMRRFTRTVGERQEQVDVFGPNRFRNLNDWSGLDTWNQALAEHEVIYYGGHSSMGTGMAFEQADYPGFYQIFGVASCLSYEYYVRPILAGKRGWENVDVISNVVSTGYNEDLPLLGGFLAKLFWGFENDGRASWQDIMEAVSSRLYHKRFGVSGARGNCFHPDGNLCDNPQPGQKRFENISSFDIPDDDSSGVISQIQVNDSLTVGSLQVELDIRHSYIGDLTVTLTHDGLTYTLWDKSGGSNDDIRQTFQPTTFDGIQAQGTWQLQVADHANLDQGSLNSWALIFTPAQ